MLGEFEQLVLLAILREDDAFGASIQRSIAEQGGRDVSLGAVYTTLARLEQKGLIEGWVGEPTAERGGRRRRHYRVLSPGRRELEASLATLRRMARGLTPRLELP
ncbi:MAG TPA: helix-turn-helix transcriptional regulator [Gemmatimonadales bacterium]|nr:helix-turn-helix transcriptional regulator [Gemmatimonadales bacterium]